MTTIQKSVCEIIANNDNIKVGDILRRSQFIGFTWSNFPVASALLLLTQRVDKIFDSLICSDMSASFANSCDVSVG